VEVTPSVDNLVQLVRRVQRAYVRRGVLSFLKLCATNLKLMLAGEAGAHRYVHDRDFDRRYRTDTSGVLETDEILAPEALKGGAMRYEATPADCFHFLLSQSGIAAPSQWTFVDLGSGKGRVVILAALAGFGRVIGVEMGANLHQSAEGNLRQLGRSGQDLPVTLVHGDATQFEFPAAPTICFLNNPFDADLMAALLDNLEQSLRAFPRSMTLIYLHANAASVIEARHCWRERARGLYQSERHPYAIYEWNG
jgi:predicted RNA methylase